MRQPLADVVVVVTEGPRPVELCQSGLSTTAGVGRCRHCITCAHVAPYLLRIIRRSIHQVRATMQDEILATMQES